MDGAKSFDLGFSVRHPRVMATVKGALKKAFFYERANYSYETALFNAELDNGKVRIWNTPYPNQIFDLYRIDAIIRRTDDLLDDVLAKQQPVPLDKMREAIDRFLVELPEGRQVAELFLHELELLHEKEVQNVWEKICTVIDLRPCDYFLLTNKIIEKFGSKLSVREHGAVREFYCAFQILRDLLDDIMSIEEDILKQDYNAIVVGKKFGINYHQFDNLITEKLSILEQLATHVKKDQHSYIFHQTIDFWRKQYEILFKPLLVSYYIDLDEFRANYFMIKQV